MKKLLFLILVVSASYFSWKQFIYYRGIDPLFEESYVAVYGRNSCGWTQQMLRNLKKSNINFHYYIVDDTEVSSLLHKRMKQAGILSGRYNLPVVDVNGKLRIRPDFENVLNIYDKSL